MTSTTTLVPGDETRVNTLTTRDQGSVATTVLSDGSYVTVWYNEDSSDHANYGMWGQHFDAYGDAIGSEFQISTFGFFPRYPSIAAIGNGGFIVYWADSSNVGVISRQFAGDGTANNAQGAVPNFAAQSIDATNLAGGGHVIIVSGYDYHTSSQVTVSWTVAADGTASSKNEVVNSSDYASAIALSGGGYALVWQVHDYNHSTFHVASQVFNSSGNAVSGVLVGNSENVHAGLPSGTGLSDGGFLMVWQAQTSSNGHNAILAQRYSASGAVVGGTVTIADDSHEGGFPVAATLSDGSYVIAWNSLGNDSDGFAVVAQHFASDGTALDTPTVVNTFTQGDQYVPNIAAFGTGGYVISWTSAGQDGDGTGVYQKLFLPNHPPVLTGTQAAFDPLPDNLTLTVTTAQLTAGYTDSSGHSYALVASDLIADHAAVTDNGDGTFTLTPEKGYVGPLGMTYRLDDGHGDYVYASNALNVVRALSAPGGESQVNSFVTSDQISPATTVLDDGTYVTVWQSNGEDGDGFGIYLQHFNAQGQPLGGEVLVNTTTAGSQISPTVTQLFGDGYVVGWTSLGSDGVTPHLQVFDGDGVKSGNEIDLTVPQDRLTDLILAPLDSGGFVAIWSSSGPIGDHAKYTYNQVFGADGTALSSAERVDSGSGTEEGPSVAYITDGYVVVWQVVNDGGLDVYSRIYNNDGSASGPAEQVNTYMNDDQYQPSVAGLADGGWIIAWVSANEDGSGYGIYSQRYDDCGCLDGAETLVNTTTGGDQVSPVITGLTDGGYVVVWQSVDGDGWGLFFQRYDAYGSKVGGETLINDYTHGDEADATVAALAGGGFAVSWDSPADGDGFGIAQKVYYTQTPVLGDAGDNVLHGEGIDADMRGGAGNDTYFIDSYSDTIYELPDEGSDTVIALVSCTLRPNIENLILINPGSVNGTGNALDNIIQGAAGNNVLRGLGGNDVLVGGGGADKMSGGAGDDTYYVDDAGDRAYEYTTPGVDDGGTDLVHASISFALGVYVENLILDGTDALNGTGNDLNNILYGNANNNQLNGKTGADTMYGGGGDDVYYVDDSGDVASEQSQGVGRDDGGVDKVNTTVTYTLGAFIENLTLIGSDSIDGTGNDLSNTLYGNAVANKLWGLGGNDKLDGQGGADTMYGGAGDDTYYVDDTSDVASEESQGAGQDDSGTDIVYASASYTIGAFIESLTLTGIADINATGNAGDNRIKGNDGRNRIDGGIGADVMTGGGGDDTYVVDNTGDRTYESDGGGNDTVESSINFTLAVYVENLILTGSAITGTGNGLDNIIYGNSGNNLLDGKAGGDTLYGGAGDDTYYIDDPRDVASEESTGLGHDDGGNDKVSATVTYTLGAFIETLSLTGPSNIDGTGNDQANTIYGNSGANTLYGLGGSDKLDGQGGADTMYGGAGNDLYYVDNTGDVVSEESRGAGQDDGGTDKVSASVSFTLGAFIENLILTGADDINGTGNTLSNALTGNTGANVLTGGAGNDALTGGTGADTFVFSHFGTANGTDRIVDFEIGIDHLQFSAADYGFAAGHDLAAAEFTVGIVAVGYGAQFVYNPTTHTLYWDSNGAHSGGLTSLASFTNGAALSASDFVFV